ncbi:hypothetical protein N5C97_15665 [Acinetobacter johnsonii]|uniref:Uncharacterized protein n=1 Tax=Acinetobacter johnsonii TaxID=40214 RepID=A0AA42SHS4_ACIJO|nr:hypothetical protein [Acinetobacter johnsonii]MDH0827889.1 hypothetical protein [Acinetobacter johnsonii]
MVTIKTSIDVSDDGSLDRFIKNAEKIGGHVEVGWLGNKNHISKGGGKRTITMADLAAIHIYGTDHIPARDPLTPAIEQNQDKYRNMIERSVVPILEGAMDISSLWQFIGLEAQGDIQQFMVNGKFAPLSPKTIKRKGSSKPLIDSGQWRQGTTYIVSKD